MPKTYYDIYLAARKRLRDMGVENYNLEAKVIAAAAAGKNWTEFFRDIRLYTYGDFEEKTEEMLRRRQEGEPVAYITGSWEFYGLPITVTPDVLIPRIDSEVTAKAAIDLAKSMYREVRVLDLCAGSGCIGIAVAAHVPNSRVVMVDNSPKAIKVNKLNIQKNSVSNRCICVEADALEPPPMLLGGFDIIVCNPPYIPTGDIPGLDPSVRGYEPVCALDGGEDGLRFYRNVTLAWKRLLNDGGGFIYECGIGQAPAVRVIMESCGLSNLDTVKDTLGVDRVVIGRM